MRPLLLAGLRSLRRNPGRIVQVAFAVALGVALFVSSYMSISGVERSIRHASESAAGAAEWTVTSAQAGGVPESLVGKLRQVPGVVAAPFLKAWVNVLGDQPEKLQVWGVDTQSDAMLKLFGGVKMPDPLAAAQLAMVPRSLIVAETFARDQGWKQGSTVRIATTSGSEQMTIAGTIPDSNLTAALGGALGFMDIHGAEQMFGQPGRVDSIAVGGVSSDQLKQMAPGYQIQSVSEIGSVAKDALLRVQSLYGLSLVAMLIGCFVVFSSVQVTVLERMKQIATMRALGASRRQLFAAILLEWALVGLLGSVAGVLFGAYLSSLVLSAVIGAVNSMSHVVSDAHVEVTWPSFVIGIAIGLMTVLTAAMIPAIAAVRESPLLALRPHTYRLRNRQRSAFWVGLVLLFMGVGLSLGGSYVQTLASIVLSFFGLALLMPQALLVVAGIARAPLSAIFGFVGFLAADNLRKAPQRTAFNVIALGGALMILVATAALVDGFTQSTHRWIRTTLPFDISITCADLGAGQAAVRLLPPSLVQKVAKVPGVTYDYGVRRAFTQFRGHDVMVLGVPTLRYLEAHRRRGTLGWAHQIAEPANVRELEAGRGVFASENLLALTGMRVGETVSIETPTGARPMRILGQIEDYTWPRGLVVTDLAPMNRFWASEGLTYVNMQIADPAQLKAVEGRITDLTRNEYAASVTDRQLIIEYADDVLRQSTSAADAQVWLAAIIGFLGIANSLVIGVLQRRREIGLLRALGMPYVQLGRTVAIEALLIGIGAGGLGVLGGLIGGWFPLRRFTFAVTGYLFPMLAPWPEMAKVFGAAIAVALLAAIIPIRRVSKVPVLTSIAVE